VVVEKSWPGRNVLRFVLKKPSRRWWAAGLLVAVAVVVVFAFLEGDLPEGFTDGVRWVGRTLRHFGDFGAFVLLYLEESGVPMPMPGDVFVMYVGHHVSHTMVGLVAAWLGLIAVVLLGATNLYFISRKWGRGLVEHRLARYIHLGPAQMRRADRWFQKWGPLALIFGRHVPGLRVPLTVGAGIFGVGYRVFAISVVISTAIWAGIFILVGVAVGGRVAQLVSLHRETYILFPIAVVIVFFSWLTFLARRVGRGDEEEPGAAG
jgi:membrane protein DedA with SNARE-associated domain